MTKEKKVKKVKDEFSVSIKIGNEVFENSGKTISETLAKFNFDGVEIGGEILITIKKGDKSWETIVYPRRLRQLLADEIARQLFEQDAELNLNAS